MATKSFGKPIVAEMDTPGTTKQSRENMHDTSHAGSLDDMDAHYKQYRRCVDAFEEIISENTEPYDILGVKRMTGEDIHKAFIEAAQSQQKWHKSELDILDSLISLSHGFKVTDSL